MAWYQTKLDHQHFKMTLPDEKSPESFFSWNVIISPIWVCSSDRFYQWVSHYNSHSMAKFKLLSSRISQGDHYESLHKAWQLCCYHMLRLPYWNNIQQWNYSKTKFVSNLAYSGYESLVKCAPGIGLHIHKVFTQLWPVIHQEHPSLETSKAIPLWG